MMKTKNTSLRLVYTLLLSIFLSTNFGCAAFFDAELKGQEIPLDENGMPDVEKMINEPILNFYQQNLLSPSFGFGLNSIEDETETSICVGAEYNYRISEDNYNGASYIGAFASYHTVNADERKANAIRFGPQYTYYDRITKNAELDLTYGIKAHYEIGSLENFGFKEDFTGYGAGLILGANYNVNDKFAIGITAPVISWSQREFEFDGGDFEQQNTWIGLNKDNVVMAYARFGF